MISEFENEILWQKQKSVDFDVYLFKACKNGMLRFLSHREWISSVERTMRRAEFPLWMTKGFHPKIKLDLNRALPTGMSSSAEYFLVRFIRNEEDLDVALRVDSFNRFSPDDLKISWGKKVFDTFSIHKFAKCWEFELTVQNVFSNDEIEDFFSSVPGSLIENKVTNEDSLRYINYICTPEAWVDYRNLFERKFDTKYPDMTYLPKLKDVYWDYEKHLSLKDIFN